MFKSIISLASVVLALTNSANANGWDVYGTTANGLGCFAPVATYSTGFNAKFFEYNGGDLIDINDNGYVADSYALGAVRTSTTGVTEPNFSFADGIGGKSIYSMYNIDMWSVLLELKGYFVAPETGLYKVTVNSANDAGFIWLGAGAFDCCSQGAVSNSYDDILLAARNDGSTSSYVYLEEGYLYPMRTTYINVYFGAVFEFEVVTPSGNVITNFEDTIINFETSDIEACVAAEYGQSVSVETVVDYSAVSSASTQWSQVAGYSDNVYTTYLVESIVYPLATSTITSTVSNTFASTTTITSINASSEPVVVVIDQVSVDASALTTTTNGFATTTITADLTDFGTGCVLNTNSIETNLGFHASVYSYNGGFGFLESSYYANEYTTEYLIGVGSNITAPNFSVTAWLGNTDTIYGANLDSWKGYVAQLTGYLYASETGIYEFAVNYSDDGSMLWIGNNEAFACCEPDTIPYNSENGALFFAKDQEKVTGYTHLVAGYYYPIRVVLVNWYGNSAMDMSMVTPSGEIISDDWSEWIISVADHEGNFCSA